MRARTRYANGSRTTRWRALLAFAGTLGLHLGVFIGLLRGPDAAIVPRRTQPVSVVVDLLESSPAVEIASAQPMAPPPPLPPPAALLIEQLPAVVPARPAQARLPPQAPIATAAPADLPAPVSFARRLEQQRRDVAAEIARENAPARRPFRERDLGAMVPGAGNGKLPGFRPRFGTPSGDLARSLGRMLEQKLPTAAVEWDAPLDPLTERWEAAHHGSDLAACERQYEDVDRDLRRQLCGEVRPPD